MTSESKKIRRYISRIIGAGLLLSLSCFTNAVAAQTDPAYAAFDEGRYLAAIKEAKKAAAKGEPQAFTLLGRIYSEGLGVPQNIKEAAKWYQQGAGKGDIESQFSLALMLAKGEGLDRNYELAADLFQQAAEKGHAEAQYNMALIYSGGLGRSQDIAVAVKYMMAAAGNGSVNAQYDLGTYYALGKGVQRNDKLAAEWTLKASKAGLLEAQVEYAFMLYKGKGVKVDRIGAFELFQGAAKKGNPIAQNRVARLYLYGVERVNREEGGFLREPNRILAAKWHLIARERGVSDSKLDLFLRRLTKEERAQADKMVQAWRGSDLLQ